MPAHACTCLHTGLPVLHEDDPNYDDPHIKERPYDPNYGIRISFHMSIPMAMHLSVNLSIHMSVHVPIHVSRVHMHMSLHIFL